MAQFLTLFAAGAFAQAPTITGLTPDTRTTGAAGSFTLTLTGTNFCTDANGGSVITFNGSGKVTVTSSATSASATILASDIPPSPTGSTVSVTLTTNMICSNGLLTSAPATFTISPPLVLFPPPPPSPYPLGDGIAGSPYFGGIVAGGGTPPYSTPIVSGANVPPNTTSPGSVSINFVPAGITTYNFLVSLTDSGGGQASQSYTFSISQATLAVLAGSPQSANINTIFSSPLAVRVTAPNGFGLYGVSVTFTPPANGASGSFAGSNVVMSDESGFAIAPPFKANNIGGAYNLVASAPGTTSTAVFNLTNLAPTPTTITVAGGSSQGAEIGTTFLNPLQALVRDAAGNAVAGVPVTFTLPKSGPGGSFTGSVSGTTATVTTSSSGIAISPSIQANSEPGPFTVNATVTGVSTPATFSLLVDPGPSISTTTLPSGVVGSAYSGGVGASGGTPPYIISIGSGALPQGLTMNTSGAITGIPQAVGSFVILAQVIDAAKQTGSRELTIRITAALTITTSSLPNAFVGISYNVTFQATGGQQPYTWSITSGAAAEKERSATSGLPPGLSFSNGTLSGSPTATGDFSFGVQLADAGGRSVSKSFSLTSAPTASAPIIQVSQSDLTFEGPANGDPPPPQFVAVVAGNQEPLSASISTDSGSPGTPSPPWLGARFDNATTPARLVITVAPAGLPPGPYTGRVLVKQSTQTLVLNVNFRINLTPAQLSVAPGFLRFTAVSGGPANFEQALLVSNTGAGGAIDFTASVAGASPWLSVSPGSGKTSTGGAPLRVLVNAQGLRIGSYYDKIHVQSPSGGSSDVAVLLFVSPSGPSISVNPSGVRFAAREGNGAGSTRELTIVNSGGGTVNWKAELQSPADWLTLSPASGQATAAAAGKVTLSVNPRALKAGPYYALIRFSDDQASNSPQLATVVLNVQPANANPDADLSPAGLFFVSVAGGPAPAPQPLQVFISSDNPTAFQAAATADDNGKWLSIDKLSGTASTQTPGQIAVSINTTGLKAGIYNGDVAVSLSTPAIHSANVTLVLLPQGAQLAANDKQRSVNGCAPAKLALNSSSLTNAFASPAGWPTPIVIRATDDCGTPAVNAQMVATFSNGDPPLALSLTNPAGAFYSGTWAPGRISPQMTVTVTGLTQGLASASAKLTGAVGTNTAPTLSANGTVNNSNPSAPGAALAPGTVAQIYGGGLTQATKEPGLIPLPTSVNDTTVLIGLIPAPLYYVSDGQINAQIPTELQPDRQYSILVSSGAAFTLPDTIITAPVSPGLLSFFQHSDYRAVNADSPVKPGESIILYLVGMGATDRAVASGTAAPSDPLARVNSQPTVTIAGRGAKVDFAGLSPGLVGLYQVNVTTPSDLPSGDATVVVTQGDATSNSVKIPVQ